MMRKTARPFVTLSFGTLSVLALMAPCPLLAQDLTDEQLLNMFLAQRDAFRAAEAGDTSATRGLTLVTLDNVDVVTETATLSAPASTGDSGSASGTSDGIQVAGAPAQPTAPGVDVAAGTVEVPAPPLEDTMVAAAAETTPTPVVLANIPQDMQVNVRIEFDFDSAALNDAQKPKLAQLCSVMNAADIQLFRIVGHTDASGSDDYNQNLSLLRAKEVQRYFITDCGIDPARLQAVGLGEKFIPDGTDPKAPENRRVEFQALA